MAIEYLDPQVIQGKYLCDDIYFDTIFFAELYFRGCCHYCYSNFSFTNIAQHCNSNSKFFIKDITLSKANVNYVP